MRKAQTEVTEMPDMEALDAALEDLKLDGGEEIVLEADVEPIDTVMGDDDLADLDLALERTEVYEAQESAPVLDEAEKKEMETAIAAGEKSRPAKAAKTAGTAPTRTPRDIGAVESEFFVLTGDPATLDTATLDAAKAATMALIPGQIKVAEKFENLFTALSVGKQPSTYVMTAFKLLDKTKTVTSADVVGAYKAIGLGEGTARSQSGQIMNLFAAVGIATRSGQTLTLNADSTIAERIRKLIV